MKKIHHNDINWEGLIEKAEKDYKFQPDLTKKLDNHTGEFTETTLLEIILWKTNRYPDLTPALLADINDLRRDFSNDKARSLLTKLLQIRGFDLPMASTVLRFACPDHLQIIDQRVYRFITEGTDTFRKPYNDDRKVEMYFEYLARLKEVCLIHNIPFNKSDRILYQLDKYFNSDHPIKY